MRGGERAAVSEGTLGSPGRAPTRGQERKNGKTGKPRVGWAESMAFGLLGGEHGVDS